MSPRKEAARKDSAVHVSLSSYSLVKQPRPEDLDLPDGTGKPSKPRTSDDIRMLFHYSSEELWRHAIAP
jgi:hypothetical protein